MPECEYHTKNRARHADRAQWDEKLDGKIHAVSPSQSYKDPYGWLVNMVNRFAYRKGRLQLLHGCNITEILIANPEKK